MLIIGEKINSTLKATAKAVAERDEAALADLAVRQMQAGANILDVNCGTVEAAKEPETLQWLVKLVQKAVDAPVCIDSANAEALAAGLEVHQGKPMVNSISGEKERYNKVLPLLKQYQASVIVLGMDDSGIPADAASALKVGEQVVRNLLDDGIAADDIYFDPLVRSVATSPSAALETLEVMRALKERFPGIHLASGLSNVSYGLPERRHLNRSYVALSMGAGLDAVIMNPFDKTMMALIMATEVLLAKDRFCLHYIEAYNQGSLSD